jgi:radical SAM superfamily enzyme YgiQ (UPF0313 family)
MLDLFLCSVPSIELYLPPHAPAALKGHLAGFGFTCKTFDLNLLMYNTLTRDSFDTLNGYFSNQAFTITDDIREDHTKVLDSWVNVINGEQFRWLGISVFSVDSRKATMDLCTRLQNRKFKIVLGGMGVSSGTLGQDLLEQGLIDAYIQGEGEHALVNLLQGNTDYPGIFTKDGGRAAEQIMDLDQLGFADYTDYSLTEYTGFYNEPVVQVTGSRGCVRNCTFCDIADLWPKFKFRSGDNIAEEIINTYEHHGIRNFYFTDSLINGSMKAYMKMCETLANYNASHNAGLRWGGQYIVRTARECPKDYFSLTAASGAFNLAMGVETGSDTVRTHMRKKFVNEDLDFTMENFAQNRITCSYLIIIGYPTETEHDFQETLRMFKRHQKYAAQGIILGVTLGATMSALDNTPIHNTMAGDITLQHKSFPTSWVLKSNPELDYATRVRRRLQAEVVCDYLGYNLISSDRNFSNILREYTNFTNVFKTAS